MNFKNYNMKNQTKTNEEVTLKSFIALIMADIDIFLLQEENQQTDKDKLFTTEEIRNQLEKTMIKFVSFPILHPMLYDLPLFEALSEKMLIENGFSKHEIKRLKQIKK
jgi:hypothetical protein